MRDIESLASIAVHCGFALHRELGPGLLESVYEILLAEGSKEAGLSVERQVIVPIAFKSIKLEHGCKADLLIERRLLIELKSTERIAPVHGKQVLTYLRLMNLPLGLLMNFGQAMFKEGVKRIVDNHQEAAV